MRHQELLAIAYAISVSVAWADTQTERSSNMQHVQRIWSTRPVRDESHLREENIRDEEVKEIQIAAAPLLPEAIVNIGGVTATCPCEDGPECSAQVWVVASNPDSTVGLMFSKFGDHWSVGPVQRWWLTRDALYARRPSFKDHDALVRWSVEEKALNESFLACAAQQEQLNNRGQTTVSAHHEIRS